MDLCAMRIRNLWGQCKGLDSALGTKAGEAEKELALVDSCMFVRFGFSL